MRRLLKILRNIVLVAALPTALVVLVATITMSGVRRFERYCAYPSKDALLAAEAKDVVACRDCAANGRRVTIVDMGWIGFLPSGAAMLVYDADGKLIDRTSDEGEDGRFQREWSGAWNDAASRKPQTSRGQQYGKL